MFENWKIRLIASEDTYLNAGINQGLYIKRYCSSYCDAWLLYRQIKPLKLVHIFLIQSMKFFGITTIFILIFSALKCNQHLIFIATLVSYFTRFDMVCVIDYVQN